MDKILEKDKTTILNVNFNTYTMEESVNKALMFLEENCSHMVVTPNPEMVLVANEDKEFLDILNKASLCIPDGIGVVYASKLNKIKITERVGGCDFTQNILSKAKDKTIYILGAGENIAQMAMDNINSKYKNVKVIGVHNGYFDKTEEKAIVEEITALKPDILLVGLGMAKQEKWIYNHMDMPVKLSIGVGGTIDVLANHVRRAPDIFIKLNLEWLYRALKQPKRFLRLLKLPLFVIKVIVDKFH
ncbi:MAG: WecB/TagA/CpsF family glycosyltransferase [Lachnospirales bacterium]